ncbi:hypothetical protein K0M31_005717, partial [Melipona bicolor]
MCPWMGAWMAPLAVGQKIRSGGSGGDGRQVRVGARYRYLRLASSILHTWELLLCGGTWAAGKKDKPVPVVLRARCIGI